MLAKSSANTLRILGLTLWVVTAFIGAQVVTSLLYVALLWLFPGLKGLSEAVTVTALAATSYGLALLFVTLRPFIILKARATLKLIGFDRLLSWNDLGFSLLAVLPYLILTSLLAWLASFMPGYDNDAQQEILFENLVVQYEYIVAFITLVVLAPIAEELLFRGYYFGKLRAIVSPWASVLITSLVFGLMHLPGAITENGITWQWAVAVDTFALGILLGSLRLVTGSVWAGIILHMLKNAVAYYFLFIAQGIPGTM